MKLRGAGWILVGGQSRRMGADKAMLRIEESQPLALVATAQLRLAGLQVSLVGDPVKYASLGLPVVPDLRPGCGPLAGIESALTATASDWNLIVACDLPSIRWELLSQLFDWTDGADAVIPRHADSKLEPLCALYHRRALPVVQGALDAGTRRVTDAIGNLTLRYLPVADDRAFCNLNTPGDVARHQEQSRNV